MHFSSSSLTFSFLGIIKLGLCVACLVSYLLITFFLLIRRYVAWIVWAASRVIARPMEPRIWPSIISPMMSEIM